MHGRRPSCLLDEHGGAGIAKERISRPVAWVSQAAQGIAGTQEHPGGTSMGAKQGGLMQAISHGFVSGAMFICIGVLYDRVHSREIAAYGGVVNTMPKFAAFFLLFAMANAGLPATSGFVGEFMVILGAVKYNFWIGLLAATTLIFGAAYSLWMYKRVVFGEVANDNVKELTDVNTREFMMLGALAILVMAMGLYPKPFTDVLQVSVDALLQHVAQSKL